MPRIQKWLQILFLILLSATPTIWFWEKPGLLIDGVDTNFPLNPLVWFKRRLFVWQGVLNTGSDFSSSVAGIFFHFIQVFFYSLGLTLQLVEQASLIFWFALIVFSGFVFARVILPNKKLPQLLFVVLYAFNIYLFNTWENIKVANLSLVAAIPLGLSLLVLAQEGKINLSKLAFLSCCVGLVVSGSGLNPAYFLVFLFSLFLFIIGELIIKHDNRFVKKRIVNSLIIFGSILLINLFWIIPTGSYISKNIPSSESIDKIGFNNWVYSLSENTSLLNVLRLQGAWDWYAIDTTTKLPLYIPYALNYFYNPIFILFSFLIPGLVILSLLFRRTNNNPLYLIFLLFGVLGVFLGVGTHMPTGQLYKSFMENIPFFTLFRSPWYIFTPLVTLSFAGLASLFFYSLEVYLSSSPKFLIVFCSRLILLSIIVGNLFYTYPLVTGKIFRPSSENGFYINFPKHIFESSDWLKDAPDGRVIGYPDNEIEEFKWGYRGIESVLALIADRDVLFSPINGTNLPVSQMIREFHDNLRRGQIDSAKSIAAKLNVGMILEKKDQKSLSDNLPTTLENFKIKSIGDWNFYQFPGAEYLPKIYTASNVFLTDSYVSSVSLFPSVQPKALVLNLGDDMVKKVPDILKISGRLILATNSQNLEVDKYFQSNSKLSEKILTRDLSKVEYNFEILSDGIFQPALERYKVEEFGINLDKGLEVEIDGNKSIWEISTISDSYIHYKKIPLNQGLHKVTLKVQNKNLIQGGSFDEGILFKKNQKREELGIFELEAQDASRNQYLKITNLDKIDISADFDVLNFDQNANYYVEAKYKHVYGNNGGILVSQHKDGITFKVDSQGFPNYPEWRVASFYFQPVRSNSLMRVELLSPNIKDPFGTKVLYDDVKVLKVFGNKLVFLSQGSDNILTHPKIDSKKINPVLYRTEVKDGKGPLIIVFAENYSPDWDIKMYTEDNQKIASSPIHFSANLYANAWYITNTPDNYKIEIFYQPQILLWVGTSFSLLTFIAATALVVRSEIKKKRKKL